MSAPPNSPPQDKPSSARVVEVTREPIELYKVLKFEAMVDSGGRAKAVIAAGLVRVNDAIELRKRKKICSGDRIEFNGERIQIQLVLDATVEER